VITERRLCCPRSEGGGRGEGGWRGKQTKGPGGAAPAPVEEKEVGGGKRRGQCQRPAPRRCQEKKRFKFKDKISMFIGFCAAKGEGTCGQQTTPPAGEGEETKKTGILGKYHGQFGPCTERRRVGPAFRKSPKRETESGT